MTRSRFVLLLLAALLLGPVPHATRAAEGAAATNAAAAAAQDPQVEFLRFVKSGPSEGHLDTAVKRYERASDKAAVTLIAVVHVGDAAYYERLQRSFERYDALLYEMIRDRDDAPAPAERGEHPISQLQVGMKRLLELEFQLDRIDYSKSNFVHADLDPETFGKLQEERGETIFGLLLKAALEEQRRQSTNAAAPLNPFALLIALASSDRGHQLKMMMGREMAQMEGVLAGIDKTKDGKGSAILSGRNEHAMKVLGQQIAKGRRNLAIFYGAGHMPDLEKRLGDQGFKRVQEDWMVAWDVRKKPKE